jgi:hypothetical protein
MPWVRSLAISARMPLTCHAAWVCRSAVPVVLLAMSRWVLLPRLNTMMLSFSLSICGPSLPRLGLPGCGEVGGQQNGGDRVFSEHGMSLLLPGPRPAQAGWMLALWWNRFWGSYSALIVASRWYLAGP